MAHRIISHYRILDELGAGGMGVVYKAEDTKLKRTVALKFIAGEVAGGTEEKARFAREAQAAASLSHPNICTIHEIDEADGRLFMAMEYVEGESLRERIARGPLAIDEALDVVLQIAQGLNAAHERGVIHRDIKPANIMIEKSGLVKIMDFGLAKLPGRSKLTRSGTTLGTVAYMSPEQTQGAGVDRRSDIWSLGALAYEMVTGRQPFKGDYEQAVLYSILNEAPEPMTAVRTGIPMELERIVGKALAKDPAERYQHADEVVADVKLLRKGLEAGAASRPAAAGAAPRGAAAGCSKPSRKRLAAMLIFLIAAAAAVAALALLRPVLFGGATATVRRPVTVIAFENQTGDARLDNLKKVIPNLLITSLEQSKHLRVVTWERQRDILGQMGKGNVEDVDTELGIELCRREGIAVIVTGSFVQLGDRFVTDIKVLRVRSKDIITSAKAEGDGLESIPEQVDELSRKIARGIGLSEPEIIETQRPVADVTTSSMEAYDWYLKGLDDYARVYYGDAIRELTRAVEIDSTFAVAYLYLGICHSALLNRTESRRALQLARANSGKATERERLYIEAQCAQALENNVDKAIAVYEELLRKYPREKWALYSLGERCRRSRMYDKAIECHRRALDLDPAFHASLNDLGYVYLNRGDSRRRDYQKALELFKRYSALVPGDANPHDSMGETYFLIGDLDRAAASYERAYDIKPQLGSATNLAYICGMRGDFTGAIVWIDGNARSAPLPSVLGSSYCWRAIYHDWSGSTNAAEADIQRALALADSSRSTGVLAIANAMEGFILSSAGDLTGARAAFETATRYQLPPYQGASPSISATGAFFSGMVDVKSGDSRAAADEVARMERLLVEVREKEPTNLRAVRNRLAFLAAEAALAEGRADDAIGLFNEHFELYRPAGASQTLLAVNSPFEQDVLARAYASKGDIARAINEYEKLLTFDPASKDRRLKNPRYEYRLAKLYERRGDGAKALGHYGKFLEYWKDADPDRPELIDAKTRVAELTRS